MEIYTKEKAKKAEKDITETEKAINALRANAGWRFVEREIKNIEKELNNVDDIGGKTAFSIATLTVGRQIALREIRKLKSKFLIK